MNRLSLATLSLALVLALCAPAFANDFYQKPPVPSSRNNPKTATTKTKKTPTSWQNLQRSNKVVKTTKPAGATQTTTGTTTAQ